MKLKHWGEVYGLECRELEVSHMLRVTWTDEADTPHQVDLHMVFHPAVADPENGPGFDWEAHWDVDQGALTERTEELLEALQDAAAHYAQERLERGVDR